MEKGTKQSAAVLLAKGSELVVQERAVTPPGPGEILVRNRVLALNPLDWKRQSFGLMIASYPTVLGTDLCAEVVEIGSGVNDFKPGDRVLSLAHGWLSGNDDNAAFQEYTLVRQAETALIPASITYNQAATLATSAATAVLTLSDVLGLPIPSSMATKTSNSEIRYPSALLVWGGASSVGSITIQLARLAGLTVFATASPKHHARLRELGASAVIDYHSSTAAEDIVQAAKSQGITIAWAIDTISSAETLPEVVNTLAASKSHIMAKLATVVPWPESLPKPEGIDIARIPGEDLWGRRADLSKWLFHEALPKWLDQGSIVPGEFRVIEGGLNAIQDGLNQLKAGSVSGVKLLVTV